MKFYHFTHPLLVDSILTHGLIAFCNEPIFLNLQPAVWLTTNPDKPLLSKEARRHALRHLGLVLSPGHVMVPSSTVCLAVDILPDARQLRHVRTMLKGEGLETDHTPDEWHIYFGNIEREKISVLKFVEPGPPFWTIPCNGVDELWFEAEAEEMLLNGELGPDEFVNLHRKRH